MSHCSFSRSVVALVFQRFRPDNYIALNFDYCASIIFHRSFSDLEAFLFSALRDCDEFAATDLFVEHVDELLQPSSWTQNRIEDTPQAFRHRMTRLLASSRNTA